MLPVSVVVCPSTPSTCNSSSDCSRSRWSSRTARRVETQPEGTRRVVLGRRAGRVIRARHRLAVGRPASPPAMIVLRCRNRTPWSWPSQRRRCRVDRGRRIRVRCGARVRLPGIGAAHRRSVGNSCPSWSCVSAPVSSFPCSFVTHDSEGVSVLAARERLIARGIRDRRDRRNPFP